MFRIRVTLATVVVISVGGLLLGNPRLASSQSPVMQSVYHDYRVVTVVEALEHPWSIAFLPGGEMLVTEQAGRLRIVRDGVLVADPIAGVPEVHYELSIIHI